MKLEVKFNFPMFTGEVNAKKLDYWIKQIEVYYRIQHIVDYEDKTQLETIKMDGTALIWWKIHLQSEKVSLKDSIYTWDHFVQMLRDQFYPLGYQQKAIMEWKNFHKRKAQSVQEYTIEF